MTKPILESVAKVLVVNENEQALILTLGEHKQQPEKSFKPDLPGGMVDPGESELAAVVRELQEETGIITSPDAYTLVYTKTQFYTSEHKSVTKLLYLLHLNSTPAVTLSWEHSNYEWVSLDELKKDSRLRSFYEEAIAYCFTNHLL